MHIELQCNGMTIACIDLLIRDKNVFVPMDITCPYPSEFFFTQFVPVPMLMRAGNTHGCLYQEEM